MSATYILRHTTTNNMAHALILGASGISGWSIMNQITTSPTPTAFTCTLGCFAMASSCGKWLKAIGPVAAGAVADRTGLDGALWLSAALHVAAVALPWAARAPRGAG